MSDLPSFEKSKRLLEPGERIAEVLFSLIMVLTFTTSLGVAHAGHDNTRAMLIGALGCNLAWGIIDALLYLMGCQTERGRNYLILRAVRKAPDSQEARHLILDALPPVLARILDSAEIDSMHRRLLQLPEPPARPRLRRDDWLAATAVFLLVFLTTFPVALPFVFMRQAASALLVSNAIAMVMLFGLGYGYGRCTGRNPWATGIAMIVLGIFLVLLTKALGG